MKPFSKLALGVFASLGISASAIAQSSGGTIEEVIVTAQRTSESIQDVPIAVSAFNAEALEARQIDTFSDLQFNVPNVSYSKTNFTGNNFQIRGIGTLLTATSGDTGVGMHVNDVYIHNPRIFETEYYDMEQVEILRGPQGTLFGRNATGGVVNLKTARPVLGETLYDVEGQLGNFDHTKVKGSVNIPVGENFAARVAGIFLDREGYTDNLLGGDIDGRDQWSARLSLRWDVSDDTRIDFVGHRFEEDSNRSRSQKQLCNFDPSAILGCIPDSIPTEPINAFATAGTLLSSNLLLGPLGLFDFFDPANGNIPGTNPSDLREVRLNFEPEYESEEDFYMLEISHDFGDYQLTLLASHQETLVDSRQDYNGTAGDVNTATLPDLFCVVSPAACTYFGTTGGGGVPVSLVPDKNNSLGAIAGGDEFGLTTNGAAVDLSTTEGEQDSFEIRLNSSFDGNVNFMIAAFAMEYESATNYFVQAAGLDYASIALAGNAGGTDSFVSLAPGYFNSETDSFELESLGIFGELYWEATDSVKVTLGIRYNEDEKSVRDRQVFLNVPVLVDVNSGTTNFLGSDGSVTPVTTIDGLVAAAAAVGDYDADPNTPGGQIYREFEESWDEYTGRFVVDWTPDVDFTDDTLIYFSYSKGFKGGGINPPIDTTLFPGTLTTFDPEDIDAFEIGTKNTLLDGTLQVNASIFSYDYGGLQIGKIVNRTSVNENTDADIFGAEVEFLWAPDEHWRLNAAVSYLDTELGDTETIDPRDPTQGRQDVSLFKDFTTAANCVLEHNGLPAPSENAAFVATIQGAGAPYIATGPAGTLGIPSTPGVVDSAFTSCAAIQAIGPAFGYGYLDSVSTNLDGNQLLNSPELTVSLGGQYTWFMGSGATLSARVDYYWQDEFYTTTFNRPQDLIDSWDLWNAQMVYTGASEKWSVTAFIQNIEDDDEITGTYQTDPSSGLFTNAFFVEPQLYGLTVKWRN